MKAMWVLLKDLTAALPPKARRFLIGYSVSLGLLAILDALSLGLLAVIIGPLISNTPVSLPLIGKVEDTGLILMLALVCLLIIAKGVASMALLWAATRRFAKYELAIGSRLFDSYIEASWVERLKRNSSDLVRLTDGSVAVTMAGFLLPASTLIGEAMSSVAVVAVLAIAQPLIAGIAMVYLGLIGALLFFWVTRRARQAGRINLKYSLKTSRLITEMVGALKEITLRGKTAEIAGVVRSNRVHTSRARSNIQFLAQVPRYVLESGLVGGFVLVGVAGYLLDGIPGALTAVALFGLAGFRMAPSIIRFQSIISQMTANMPHARAVLDEIGKSEETSIHLANRPSQEISESPQALVFEHVSFRYSPETDDAVHDVSIRIPFGSSVAFVGSSGAGKSTMVDLLLGLIEPTDGVIRIDETSLTKLTRSWRTRIAYVPQEVSLFDASVAENVALSWSGEIDLDRVRAALAQAQLLTAIEARPGGLSAPIGERGLALSGGQRQRLGIARALYNEPMVLVMDEATSALDTATEAAVSSAIKGLRGKMTIVTVAHRLSTVMHSDEIFFMTEGNVAARGTFDELVKAVPEFALQAGLAGLTDDETN